MTSLYASWDDVDGTRREEPHSGVDGGRLGDQIYRQRQAMSWRCGAELGLGEEQALLIEHTKKELDVDGRQDLVYFSEFGRLD